MCYEECVECVFSSNATHDFVLYEHCTWQSISGASHSSIKFANSRHLITSTKYTLYPFIYSTTRTTLRTFCTAINCTTFNYIQLYVLIQAHTQPYSMYSTFTKHTFISMPFKHTRHFVHLIINFVHIISIVTCSTCLHMQQLFVQPSHVQYIIYIWEYTFILLHC